MKRNFDQELDYVKQDISITGQIIRDAFEHSAKSAAKLRDKEQRYWRRVWFLSLFLIVLLFILLIICISFLKN